MYLPLILELVLLFVLGVIYWQVDRKVKYLNREEDKVLHRAHKRARRIAQEAKDQAVQTVEQARLEVKEQLSVASQQQLEKYKAAIDKVAKTLETSAASEVEAANKSMRAKVAGEVSAYQQTQMERVDQQIEQILQTTAHQVLGQTLSLAQHSELVSRALQEAKEQHVFTPA